jgi:AcrR family transcriptional regulator
MRKRKSRAELTEDNGRRLLQAARKVFTRRGFHAATLDQVAEAAGFTKGAVYARFESKADLMLALLEQRLGERIGQIEAAAQSGAGATAETTALALGRQWIELNRGERDWALLLAEFRAHVARDPALNARYRVLHSRLRKAMACMF